LLSLLPSESTVSYRSVEPIPKSNPSIQDQLIIAGKVAVQEQRANLPCLPLMALVDSIAAVGQCLWEQCCSPWPEPERQSERGVETLLVPATESDSDGESGAVTDFKRLKAPPLPAYWDESDLSVHDRLAADCALTSDVQAGFWHPIHMSPESSKKNLSFAVDIPESERI